MQFQMPRFLDIEDKVIGPLTFKQFIYLVGGTGLAYVAYSYLGWTWGFIFIALFLGLGIGLAFWKPNNRPAPIMLQAFLSHYTKNRMYVWQRPTKFERMKKDENKNNSSKNDGLNTKKEINHDKIEALSWSLDIMDRK
jgi:hypothetical protein